MVLVFKSELGSAIKSLGRRPLATALLAISLGVGMSVATSVFGMLQPLVSHPPFADSKHVLQAFEFDPKRSQESPGVSARHLLALREAAGPWATVAGAKAGRPLVFGLSGSATTVSSILVTPNFFELVSARMAIGREFGNEDGTLGAPAVAVVSHATWRNRLGGPTDLADCFITVDAHRVRVVGVLPPSFAYPFDAEVWLPLGRDEIRRIAASPTSDWPRYLLIGRIRDSGLPAAMAWSQAIVNRADSDAGVKESPRIRLLSVADAETRDTLAQSTVWIAIASIVLLLCATNFATGFLGIAMSRRKELAIRSALGASTRRLALLLFAETLLLGLLGGVIAILLSIWLSGLTAGGPSADPRLAGTFGVGWQVILFGVVGTILVGIVFGLAPILQLCRGDLRQYMSDVATPTKTRLARDRGALVGLQISLAVLCIASVAVLVYADSRFDNFGPGYDYHSVVTARVLALDSASHQIAEQPLLDFVRAIPGVKSAALVRSPAGERGAIGLSSEEHVYREAGVPWVDASSGFFSTLGVVASSGRLPTSDEITSRAPVAVLTASAALNVGPHPIGRRIRLNASHGRLVWLTVIGVVPDVRRGPDFSIFDTPVFSSLSPPSDSNATRLMIRVLGDADASVHTLEKAFARIDVPVVISDVKSVSSEVGAFEARARQRRGFLGAISLVSLILASIGAYGLSSYIATARAKEIYIRIALGGSLANVTRAVLGDLFAMALGGSILGLVIASRFAEMLNVVLRGPRGTPVPLTQVPVAPAIAGAALLLGISLLGSLVPIRRVTKQSVANGLR